jgi:chitodextrinase
LTLSWNASADDVAVAGYTVYVDGASTSTTQDTSYSFSGLSCGTSYVFGVDAYDAAGNYSAATTITAAAAACPDTSAPTPPTGFSMSATSTSLTLSWSVSSDNVGVAGYTLYRDGTSVGTTQSTTYTFGGLVCGTGYTLAVDAYDATGNHSTKAAVTGATAACSDSSAPTTPSGFIVSGQTPTSVTVSWSPSSDNVGVAGYTLYRDGTTAGTTQSTSYTFTGLTCGTSYTLAVDAYDATGNHSAKSTMTAAAAACSSPPPSSSTVRINAGGALYTSANGNTFAADVYYTGGSAANGADPVSGTADPTLYKDERWGNFAYAIPAANGTYDVRLHFVELYFNAPCTGKRSFSVDVTNTATNPDVANLDICATVGPNTALVRTITNVNVTDGFVRLQAVYSSADDPEIAAIEVVPAGSGGADTSPPTAPAGLSVGNQTQTGLTLSWSASTDNTGVAGYAVYRDGTAAATTQSTSYALSGLTCGTSYILAVDAFDAAGNHSTKSTITAKTSDCPSPQPSGPCGTTATPPTTYAHVIWIWMENKSYDQIIGSSEAPFENQLAQQCGLATNYTAATHPSLPNYIAATSGDYWGISDNNPPASHPLSVPSIYSQVRAAGKEWREYEENAPGNCPQDTVYPYAVKHDPAAYYTGIRNDCFNWNVPMGTTSGGNFLNDLSSNSLPAFAFITPDLCNDTHDCSVATGDAWLKSWISLILTGAGYKSGNTALFLTWDEDDGSSTNRVVTVVVSPSTRPGTTSSTAFTHYSLLKTTEQMLGITTYLGHAGDPGTASMRAAFNS